MALSQVLQDKFDQIRALEAGWYIGADKIDARAIDRAIGFVEGLLSACEGDFVDPWPVPCCCGSVQLEWHLSNFDIEIMFSPNNGFFFSIVPCALKNGQPDHYHEAFVTRLISFCTVWLLTKGYVKRMDDKP